MVTLGVQILSFMGHCLIAKNEPRERRISEARQHVTVDLTAEGIFWTKTSFALPEPKFVVVPYSGIMNFQHI